MLRLLLLFSCLLPMARPGLARAQDGPAERSASPGGGSSSASHLESSTAPAGLSIVVVTSSPPGLYSRVLGQSSDLDVTVHQAESLEEARGQGDIVVWLQDDQVMLSDGIRVTGRPLPAEREPTVRYEAAALIVRGVVQAALADRQWSQQGPVAPEAGASLEQPGSGDAQPDSGEPTSEEPRRSDQLPSQQVVAASAPSRVEPAAAWALDFAIGGGTAGVASTAALWLAPGAELQRKAWAVRVQFGAAFPGSSGNERLRFRLEQYSGGAQLVRRWTLAPLVGLRVEAGGGLAVYRRTTQSTGSDVTPTADSWTPSAWALGTLGAERPLSPRLTGALLVSLQWLSQVPRVQVDGANGPETLGAPENLQGIVGLRLRWQASQLPE